MKIEYGLGIVTLIGDKARDSSGIALMAMSSTLKTNIRRGVFASHISQIIPAPNEEDVSNAIRAIHFELNKINWI
jgi:aspartokinase